MKNNNHNKKLIFLSMGLILTITILGIGVAYAYFAASYVNLESSSTINVESGSIAVTYTNGTNNINASNVDPGWSASKYFTIASTNKTTKTYNYSINLYVDNNNFDLTNDAGNSYLTYSLAKCTSSGSGCTTNLSSGVVNRKFYEIYMYSESISSATAGTKYYSLTISYPNDVNNIQSQYGVDGNLLAFAGHITISSDDKLSQ